MKAHLIILAAIACLAGCVSRPMVKIVHPDGTVEWVYLGGNVAAESDNVIASVKTASGTEAKYAAKREDGTSVLNNYIGADLSKALSAHRAHSKDLQTTTGARSKDLKTVTDGAIKLKATDDPEHLPEIPLDPNKP